MSPNAHTASLVEFFLGQRLGALSLLDVMLNATKVCICL